MTQMHAKSDLAYKGKPIYRNPGYLAKFAGNYLHPFRNRSVRDRVYFELWKARADHFEGKTDEKSNYKTALALLRQAELTVVGDCAPQELTTKAAVHLSRAIAEHAQRNSKYSCCTAYNNCSTERYLTKLTQALEGVKAAHPAEAEEIAKNLLAASKQIMLHFSIKTDQALNSLYSPMKIQEWVEIYGILSKFVKEVQKLVLSNENSSDAITSALLYGRFLAWVNYEAKSHAAISGTIPGFAPAGDRVTELAQIFGMEFNSATDERKGRFIELLAASVVVYHNRPEEQLKNKVERTRAGLIANVYGYPITQ
ncbi:MAG: hypothetical protein WCT31_04895 [Candidatus Micrarchaeia archaeon]